MGRLLSVCAGAHRLGHAAGTARSTAGACGRLELAVDARLVASDGRKSFLDGGLGALRYGEDRSVYDSAACDSPSIRPSGRSSH